MYKPTKDELLAAKDKSLPDVIDYNVSLLFCGINPGLYTAAVGHHFARPGNRFWKSLYKSGFTERLLSPFDENELLLKGIGITNLVARATNRASEIKPHEFIEGGIELRKKIRKYKPQWVAFVGIGAYRTAFQKPYATAGKQNDQIDSASIWLLPSTSGLNANHTPVIIEHMFQKLRLAVGI